MMQKPVEESSHKTGNDVLQASRDNQELPRRGEEATSGSDAQSDDKIIETYHEVKKMRRMK